MTCLCETQLNTPGHGLLRHDPELQVTSVTRQLLQRTASKSHPAAQFRRDRLFKFQQMNVKNQNLVGADGSLASAFFISQLRGDVESPVSAWFHQLQSFCPAGDDARDLKVNGFVGCLWSLTIVGTIEHFAAGQSAFVMCKYTVCGLGRSSFSGLDDFVLQATLRRPDALAFCILCKELLTFLEVDLSRHGLGFLQFCVELCEDRLQLFPGQCRRIAILRIGQSPGHNRRIQFELICGELSGEVHADPVTDLIPECLKFNVFGFLCVLCIRDRNGSHEQDDQETRP